MATRGLIAFGCGVTVPLLVLLPLMHSDGGSSDTSLLVSCLITTPCISGLACRLKV